MAPPGNQGRVRQAGIGQVGIGPRARVGEVVHGHAVAEEVDGLAAAAAASGGGGGGVVHVPGRVGRAEPRRRMGGAIANKG